MIIKILFLIFIVTKMYDIRDMETFTEWPFNTKNQSSQLHNECVVSQKKSSKTSSLTIKRDIIKANKNRRVFLY